VKVLLLDVARGKAGPGPALSAVQNEVSRWLDSPTRSAWLRWSSEGVLPPEARLLAALSVTLPQAGRLGDLLEGLDRRRRVLAVRYGTLRDDLIVPKPLLGLVVNEQK